MVSQQLDAGFKMEVDDRWSEIVTVHVLIQAVRTGDATFVEWVIDANDATKHAAVKYSDALWAAVQTTTVWSERRSVGSILRVFTDESRVSLSVAVAAGDIQMVRTKLHSTDITSQQLLLAAEQCIGGGVWRDLLETFAQTMTVDGSSHAMPDCWLSYLTQPSTSAAETVDVSSLLTHVTRVTRCFCRHSRDLRYVGSRQFFTLLSSRNACTTPGVYLIIGDGTSLITIIDDMFLQGCTGLTALDLTPLAHLTSVGDGFLRGCSGLTALDLTPVAHLTRLGDYFLDGCSGVTVLDLTPLAHLTCVGNWFLDGCTGLTALNLEPLAHLTSVGTWFLHGCSGLMLLDLAPLAHLTGVAHGFLRDCSGVTVLDLTPLAHLTCVPNGFLRGCWGLTALDLTPLAHLTSVGNWFLDGCTGLTALNLETLAHLTSVGDGFLRGCTALDLEPLAQLTSVSDGFLASCTGLAATRVTILSTRSVGE